MKRIFWVSDLVVETGFSRVSHSLISRLLNSFDIVGFGINHYGYPHDYPFDIYPASVFGDIFGFRQFDRLVNKIKPDIIFILQDAWVQTKYLEILKKSEFAGKVVTYTPVDGENHNPHWYQNFDIVSRAITYTQFGKRVIEQASGYDNILVIPHGLDKNVFYKIDRPINILREEFFKTDAFNDKFIVLSANRNQPRKRLDILMQGFALFAKNAPDAVLYMHCGIVDSSIDVLQLARWLGIYDRLIISNKDAGIQQVPRSVLNVIYNVSDVGVNTSWGEGWGLVNFEHASIGKPQIVPEHSAFPEVFGDTAVYVEPTLTFFVDNQMTTANLVPPEGVAEGLRLVYENKGLYKELSEKSYQRFSDPVYSWDSIAERFKSVFDEVLCE